MQTIETTIHGIPVNACEARGGAVVKGQDDNWYFTVTSKNFIINVNLDTKESSQINIPAGNNGTFCSKGSKDGYYYTSNGNSFVQFNPADNRISDFIFNKNFSPLVAMRLEPNLDKVYMVGYPDCVLREYDVKRKRISKLARLDDTQKYCTSIVSDGDYLYIGIGTEKKNIIAYNIKTNEYNSLILKDQRNRGGYKFYKGTDNKIYFLEETDDSWGILKDGAIVEKDVSFPGALNVEKPTHTFLEIHNPTSKKSIINSYSVEQGYVDVNHPVTGEKLHIQFDYKSEGALLSPLIGDKNGIIYGTSNHPLNFYSYDPKEDVINNYNNRPLTISVPNSHYKNKPGDLIKGNICTYSRYKNIIGGAAYSGGYVLIFDTNKPIESGKNPVNVATYEQMHRPRGSAFSKDGKIFASGGFGGYGAVGGAISLYNLKTEKPTLITHEDIAEYESPLCMDFINDDILAVGTSVDCPGGGTPKASTASIVLFDVKNMKKTSDCKPLEDVSTIWLLKADKKGLIHCFTKKDLYFVYDPKLKKVIYQKNITLGGRCVQNGLLKREDNLILFMSKGIYKIDTSTFKESLIGAPTVPVTMGGALIDNRLYFASNQKLCSIAYKEE